jgi:hypothetical protein
MNPVPKVNGIDHVVIKLTPGRILFIVIILPRFGHGIAAVALTEGQFR